MPNLPNIASVSQNRGVRKIIFFSRFWIFFPWVYPEKLFIDFLLITPQAVIEPRWATSATQKIKKVSETPGTVSIVAKLCMNDGMNRKIAEK